MDLSDLNIKDILKLIKKRFLLIGTIVFIVSTITVIYAFSLKPVYTSSLKVLIEEKQTNPLDSNPFKLDRSFLPTQHEILKSLNVAKNVVKILELDRQQRQRQSESQENKVSFLAALKATATKYVTRFLGTETVDSTPVKSIPEKQAVSVVELDDDFLFNLAKNISYGLKIIPSRNTNVITLMYSHANPVTAQLIVSTYVQAYIDETMEINMSAAKRELKWISDKTSELKIKLETSEAKLQRYMKERDMVIVENRITIIPERLAELGSKITAAESRLGEFEARNRILNNIESDVYDFEAAQWLVEKPEFMDLRQRINEVDQRINDLSKKFGEKHPVMVKTRAEHKALQKDKQQLMLQLIKAERGNYELAKATLNSLQNQLAKTKQEAIFLNENLLQYSRLQRKVENDRLLYQAFLKQLNIQGISDRGESINVRIIEPARVPRYPSSPNRKKLAAFGLMLGLAAGFGFAFLLEILDNTVKTGEVLEKRYDGTVLGTIAQTKDKKFSPERLVHVDPLSVVSESYKAIRTSVLLSSADSPPKKIIITSMSPKEGKSTVSSNLATTFADNNLKVMLVDCDLRKSRVHKIFGLDNEKGLSTYLAGASDQDIITNDPTIANHCIIPAGPAPPNPAELLGSQRFKNLVKKLEKHFDIILFDSPPVMNVTDSLLLSSVVDGMVIVCRAGKTKFEMLDQGMKSLAKVDAKILGYIINGIDIKQSDYAYYSYKNPYIADEFTESVDSAFKKQI